MMRVERRRKKGEMREGEGGERVLFLIRKMDMPMGLCTCDLYIR